MSLLDTFEVYFSKQFNQIQYEGFLKFISDDVFFIFLVFLSEEKVHKGFLVV